MSAEYRLGVGIVVLNAEKKVFVAQRIDNPSAAWQMPQGGLDAGEEPLDGVLRELEEETSIAPTSVSIIAESDGWLSYDFPDDLRAKLWGGRFSGQKQKWYLARFTGDEAEINLETEHPEFSAWQWIDFDQTVEMIVAFKRPLYELIYQEFAEIVAQQ